MDEERNKSDNDGSDGVVEKTIDELKATAIALFGVTPLEAGRMTPYEWGLYNIAYQIKRQKEFEFASFQSWQNQQVKATRKKGAGKNATYVSLYKTFNDFYDSEKAFNSIFDDREEIIKKKKKLTIAEVNRLINKKKGG